MSVSHAVITALVVVSDPVSAFVRELTKIGAVILIIIISVITFLIVLSDSISALMGKHAVVYTGVMVISIAIVTLLIGLPSSVSALIVTSVAASIIIVRVAVIADLIGLDDSIPAEVDIFASVGALVNFTLVAVVTFFIAGLDAVSAEFAAALVGHESVERRAG